MTGPQLVPLRWDHGQIVSDLPLPPPTQKPASLTILHTNDFHSSIDGRLGPDGKCHGGLARIAGTIRSSRELGPTLVVDAGDTVFGSGTWWDAQGAGVTARLKAQAGYQLATIGNHDVERGLQGLRELLSGGGQFVAANVHVADRLVAARIHPAMVAFVGGFRVGVIGLTTLDTVQLTPAFLMRGIVLQPPNQVITATVAALEPLVDVIVVLSHLGLDGAGHNDRWLADTLAGSKVAAILGGHTHEALDPAPVRAGIVICNAGAYGANVNEVRLDRTPDGCVEVRSRLIPQDGTVQPDEQMALAIEEARQEFQPLFEASYPLPMLRGSDQQSRKRDLLLRAVRHSALFSPNALLMVPGCYLPGQLPPGDCANEADIYGVFPSIERLVEVELNGSSLRQLLRLELLLTAYEACHPAWLADGEPVLAQSISDDASYRVVVTELPATGGRGWDIAARGVAAVKYTPVTCLDAVRTFLQDTATSMLETGNLILL